MDNRFAEPPVIEGNMTEKYMMSTPITNHGGGQEVFGQGMNTSFPVGNNQMDRRQLF